MRMSNLLTVSVSLLAIGASAAGLSGPAYAASSGNSEYVKNVDIDFAGPAPVINVINMSSDKHVKNIKLSAQGASLSIGIDGFVECKDANNVDFMGAHAYFGGVGVGGFGQLNTSATLHSQQVDVAYKESGNVAEATEDAFTVPLNKIKQGHPALRVDPLEELEKARQAFNGGDVEFFRNDREIVLQRPISLGAICGKLKNTDERTVGFETKNVTIKIRYKGDPAINNNPVLNAQMANNPNQIQQNPNLPFQLNDVTFQPNMPNYTGKCLPDQNPKIRVNFSAAGGKQGVIDLRIAAVSNQYGAYGPYFETAGIVNNPKNGAAHLDFIFPLKEMLAQGKYAWMAVADNKTHSHNMRIEARFKNMDGSNEWSEWQQFDTAVFKHRCTPQLNPNLSQGNAGIGGFDKGGAQADPVRQPADKIQAAPQKASSGYIKIDGVKGE